MMFMAEACLGAKCEVKSDERQGLSSALGVRGSQSSETLLRTPPHPKQVLSTMYHHTL